MKLYLKATDKVGAIINRPQIYRNFELKNNRSPISQCSEFVRIIFLMLRISLRRAIEIAPTAGKVDFTVVSNVFSAALGNAALRSQGLGCRS